MLRGLLTDEEWSFFEPFVTAANGRPPGDHRRTLDAVFWIARTGAPWRDLPDALGNSNSVHKQFRRWTTGGLWDLMLEALAEGGGSGSPWTGPSARRITWSAPARCLSRAPVSLAVPHLPNGNTRAS